MILTAEQVNSYKQNGALVVRDIFKPWINVLREGFEKVLKNPGPHARENINKNENGRFFEDYCNWHRIPEFLRFVKESPAAQIVAEATNSKSIQVFHDHIFVKDPDTNKPTPWHQDMPYYCVDGEDTGSYWIPLDEVSKENTLKIILGSHKWSKLVQPTKWSNDKPWYKNETDFMDMPDIESIENEIMVPDLKLGDAILFNFKTVHGAPGNNTKNQRRAFSMRFIGDDVRYIDREGETSPPFAGINLKVGDTLRTDWFPVVWSR
jgi:ectoine hydroxylase-related dioxygenase (phytanoyl-CoA dioxygenase family)|tara:strand:+ start:84 stop:875 length:792 start_codon:yes stop_codon:yes gene_type:complete